MKQRSNVRRLFAFVLRYYKINFVVVFICIAVSSVISLATSLFTRTLIDDHITPMLASGADLDAAYSALALALVKLGAILLVGIICGYLHNLLMIYVGQGTMRRLRDSLFTHMEGLPLRYFDSHSHGDIMSVYTNDVDTLRQVIGSSIPNLVKSVVTIVATLVSMLVLSLPLTLITVVMALCIYRVTTGLGKLSKKYFVQRQQNLGKVNGFIEEMVSGQKVVKAYCREDRTGEEFEVLNEALRASVYNANKIGNIIMPVNHNISNFGYVALSVAGALIALGGFSQWYFLGLNGSVLTLGTLVSFLTLQRNFTRPVQQISNEINSIVMASAGADRLFALLDETPEPDEGKVVLVNATADIPSQDLRHPRLRGGTGNEVNGGAERSEAVGEGILPPGELREAITVLNDLAHKLKEKRFKAGAVDFDRPEMKVEVDEQGRPVNVYQKVSKEANWLIEEFMLLANRTVAEFIATDGQMNGVASKKAKTFVYRIHDVPNTEKLESLKRFAKGFGYKMADALEGRAAAKSINALMKQAAGKPELEAFEDIALRSMAKACYSTDNIGHYGLAFDFYTHFTSPIRRYPDTMVHRLLTLYLAGKESQNKGYYEIECQHASEREVIAADAERTSVKYKLVEYMQDKVGMEFDGRVSGVTEWGMYVEIEPTKIEGMVSLREIRSDFFEFDEERYRLVGKRTHKIFRLGDKVRIRVKNANLEQRLLDFELIENLK